MRVPVSGRGELGGVQQPVQELAPADLAPEAGMRLREVVALQVVGARIDRRKGPGTRLDAFDRDADLELVQQLDHRGQHAPRLLVADGAEAKQLHGFLPLA